MKFQSTSRRTAVAFAVLTALPVASIAMPAMHGKMSGSKMSGHKMMSSSDKMMMGMSASDKMMMKKMMMGMSSSEKKTMMGMSMSERNVAMKMAHMCLMMKKM